VPKTQIRWVLRYYGARVSVAQGLLTRDGRRTRPIAVHARKHGGDTTSARNSPRTVDQRARFLPGVRSSHPSDYQGAHHGRQARPTTVTDYGGVFWSRRWAIEVGETEQQGASMIFIELRSEVRNRSTTTATRALRACRRRTRRGGLRGGCARQAGPTRRAADDAGVAHPNDREGPSVGESATRAHLSVG
jgi:hypothetical protein